MPYEAWRRGSWILPLPSASVRVRTTALPRVFVSLFGEEGEKHGDSRIGWSGEPTPSGSCLVVGGRVKV